MGLLDVLSSAKDKFAPSALSPKKRFGKAVVDVCALMVMADGEAEEAEIEKAYEFLSDIEAIRSCISPEEVSEMFRASISALARAYKKSSIEFKFRTSAVVLEISSSVTSEGYRNNLIFIAKNMAEASSSDGADEKNMIIKLEKALKVS